MTTIHQPERDDDDEQPAKAVSGNLLNAIMRACRVKSCLVEATASIVNLREILWWELFIAQTGKCA